VRPRAGRAALFGLAAAPLFFLALSGGAVTAGAAGQRSPRAAADETVFLTNMGKLTLGAGAARGTDRCAGCASHSLPTVSGDGYVQFRAADVTAEWVGGLGWVRPAGGFADVDFALRLTGAGAAEVYENGALVARVAKTANDVFRIAAHGEHVAYSKNGRVFYSSARTPVYPLRVAVAPWADRSAATGSAGAPMAAPASAGGGIADSPPPSRMTQEAGLLPSGRGPLRWSSPAFPANQNDPDSPARAEAAGGGPGSSNTSPAFPGSSIVPSSSPGGGPVAATVQFVGLGQDGGVDPGAAFSGQTLRDLLVDVTWNLPGGSHVQRLELFSPDGALYQRFSVPLDNPGTATTLETRLPVGGTWITEHSLFGTWRVLVYLDNNATPVATAGFGLSG
jgi:hypothetical protein